MFRRIGPMASTLAGFAGAARAIIGLTMALQPDSVLEAPEVDAVEAPLAGGPEPEAVSDQQADAGEPPPASDIVGERPPVRDIVSERAALDDLADD